MPLTPKNQLAPRDALLEYTPWMETYRKYFGPWLYQPFAMYGFKPNFRSNVINMDNYGLRYTHGRDEQLIVLDTVKDQPCNLITGGSVAFGQGATNDHFTTASVLSRNRNESWLNMGIGGHVLQQSLVQLTFLERFTKKIDRIVLFGGLNELTVYLLSELFSPIYGGVFLGSEILNNFNKGFHTLHGADAHFDGSLFVRLTDHAAQREVLLESLIGVIGAWKKLARSLESELHFFLQPYPGWMTREPIEKERLIWQRLDEIHGQTLCDLVEPLAEAKNWYPSMLAEACAKFEIPFHNLNIDLDTPSNKDKWLFVDRAHLTDIGYAETADAIGRYACG
jgi:hypothetical protein